MALLNPAVGSHNRWCETAHAEVGRFLCRVGAETFTAPSYYHTNNRHSQDDPAWPRLQAPSLGIPRRCARRPAPCRSAVLRCKLEFSMEAVSFDAQGRPLASTVGAKARDLPLTPERVLDAVAAGATSCEAARA